MNTFIVTVLLVVSVNCQSPAFDSFMARNRNAFSGISPVASPAPQSFGQQSNQQQQQFQGRSSFGRSLAPSVDFASPAPFVTSNSHIQAFNQPQPSAGSPTTISGPNFQTSITLPALPALPMHPAGSPAALAHQQHQQHQQNQLSLQQSQFQPQPAQAQPQLTQQFSTHVHNHQFPSSVNQQPSASFFNPQGNTNFPFNFQSPQSAPLNLPTPPTTPPSTPQSFGSLGFGALQGQNNFFAPQQPQIQQQQPAPFSSFGSAPSTTIRAPGFETTFVFMRPSEQPAQGASLSKVIRDPSGIERQMYYVPMPNYSPPSVYNTQIVHDNPATQQQPQGQQQ